MCPNNGSIPVEDIENLVAMRLKVFLEILQNSQENTCVRVSFLIELQVSGRLLLSVELVNLINSHILLFFY